MSRSVDDAADDEGGGEGPCKGEEHGGPDVLEEGARVHVEARLEDDRRQLGRVRARARVRVRVRVKVRVSLEDDRRQLGRVRVTARVRVRVRVEGEGEGEGEG